MFKYLKKQNLEEEQAQKQKIKISFSDELFVALMGKSDEKIQWHCSKVKFEEKSVEEASVACR